ncbi:MAG: RHS repeat protein, partial [Pirellulaceae bacterium]|nr:RHS repeat protein [Pirellulaceae bacterium]
VHDALGRPESTWIGTDDEPSSGDWSPTNNNGANMVLVSQTEYDGGGVGDSRVTKVTRPVDGTTANDLVTQMKYDWRGRLAMAVDPEEFTDGATTAVTYTRYEMDNLGRRTKVERYFDADDDQDFPADGTADAGDRLLARSESLLDAMGRPYQVKQYGVNPTNGTVNGNVLIGNTLYNGRGGVVKSQSPGTRLFTKTTHDGLGRGIATYVGFDVDESTHAEALTLAGDTILEQTETDYAYHAAGYRVKTTAYARKHNGAGTGALTDSNARISYAIAWQDAAGRTTHAANYGTNGGSAPTDADPPSSSDTVLVSQTNYNDAGEAFEAIDPKGVKTTQEFDDAGRLTRTIQNDVASATGPDEDVTVEFEYNSAGRLVTLTAVNAATGNQQTRYVYGTAVGGATPAVYSNDLLRAEIYPDSDDTTALADGTDGVYDRVEYLYDRQGRRIQMKDQNQTVHDYVLDKGGRLLADKITLPQGSTIDASILRIERTYTVRGQLETITSYDAAAGGNAVNQLTFAYNDFGQTIESAQDHLGVVTGSSPKVQYGYEPGTAGHIRPTATVYPNGDEVRYDYGTADEAGDVANRVVALKDYRLASQTETTVAAYEYLGLGRVVEADLPVPQLRLDYDSGTAGQYAGFDRFGRVVDHRWETHADVPVARIGHGYDRNGNRLWREDSVAAANNEDLDELYDYDGVNRLKDFERGDVTTGANPSVDPDSKTFAEQWSLDALGNWSEFKQDDAAPFGAGNWTLEQQRLHNKANEIDNDDNHANAPSGSITATVGGDWVDPIHDAVGNTWLMPIPASPTNMFRATYDAWNRLTKLEQRITPTTWFVLAVYRYDGLNRRIVHTVLPGTGAQLIRHFYYNEGWQCLEERRQSGSAVSDYA